MAPFGRGVPAAATAGLEGADPFAGRDGGTTTAGRLELQVMASGCYWGTNKSTRGLRFDSDSGITFFDFGHVTLPQNFTTLTCSNYLPY